MLITETVESSTLADLGRLDAWYFLSPGAGASRRLDFAKTSGLVTRRLGGEGGLADVWMPGRLTQVTAAPGEPSRPYLKPHDLFRYLTNPSSHLSAKRTKKIDDYKVKSGLILQTRSGRNLGPCVVIDRYLSRFVVSDDLIRIWIEDDGMRSYVAAYLLSATGRALLRRDKSGSVIDHLSVPHVQDQEIPMLGDNDIASASKLMARACKLVEEAREALSNALGAYENSLPNPKRADPAKLGWGLDSSALSDRLDAASYDPWVAEVRKQLLSAGGVPVAEVADVKKPPGRYKTYYVGADYGIPFLSGTQILQLEVINQRYMAPKTFGNPDLYKLRKGWSVYQADGRAEEALGMPAFVPKDREGWAASGHVGRLLPKNGTNAGWLWLAASTWQVQIQIKSLASGSVVDSTYPADMERVILPPEQNVDGAAVEEAWAKFTEARELQRKATQVVDDAMAAISGISDDELELVELQEAEGLGDGVETDEPDEDAVAEESGDEGS